MTKGGWSWADLTSAPPGQMIYRKAGNLTGIWAIVTPSTDGFHARVEMAIDRQDRIFKTMEEAQAWAETLIVERELSRG